MTLPQDGQYYPQQGLDSSSSWPKPGSYYYYYEYFYPHPQADPERDVFVGSLMKGGLGSFEPYNPWRPSNYLEFMQYASHLGALPVPSEIALHHALGRMGLHPDLTRIQGGLIYHFDPNSRRWRVVGTAEQLYYMSLDIQRELEREKIPPSFERDLDILYRVRPRSVPDPKYPNPFIHMRSTKG